MKGFDAGRLLGILMVVVFGGILTSGEWLKEIGKIGGGGDHYEFFMITSVDLDKDGNIYVADSKGRFIRKYSKNGKFLKETGKMGRGPGDFMGPLDLTLGNNKIFVLDGGNRRIAIYDKELKRKPQYIKITEELGYPTNVFFMNNLLYLSLMLNLDPNKNDNRIVGITPESRFKIIYAFFNHFPDYYKRTENELQMAMYMGYLFLKVALDKNRKEIVSCYMHPGEKVNLYYYNYQGKFIKKQSFTLLKGYQFPKFLLKYPKRYPKKYTFLQIDSIRYYKDKYVLLHYLISRITKSGSDKNSESTAYIAVIDTESGKIIGKYRVPSGLRIFKVKGNYSYGKDFNDDAEGVNIYEIRF